MIGQHRGHPESGPQAPEQGQGLGQPPPIVAMLVVDAVGQIELFELVHGRGLGGHRASVQHLERPRELAQPGQVQFLEERRGARGG
jgi:hypothetical protein